MVAVAIAFSLNHALILRLARLEQQFRPAFLCGLCALLSVRPWLITARLILTHLRQKGYRPKAPKQPVSPPHTSSLAGIKTPPPKTPRALSASLSESAAPTKSTPPHSAASPHAKLPTTCSTTPP